jgi:hypothetical protein
MAGIVAYGAYIPWHRMDRKLFAKTWGGFGVPGEKAVAYHDEDSVTMPLRPHIFVNCQEVQNEKMPYQIDGSYHLDCLAYSKSDSFPLYESAASDAILDDYFIDETVEEKETYAAQIANYYYDQYVFIPLLAVDKTYVTHDTVANWNPSSASYLALEYATHPEPLNAFRLFEKP